MTRTETGTKRSHLRDAVITILVLAGLALLALTQLSSRQGEGRRPGPPVSGNAYHLVETLTSPTLDLEGRMKLLPEIMGYAEYRRPETVPPASAAAVSSFLEYQVVANLARVESLFLLLEGRRTESLRLLSAVYYLGQLMTQDEMDIARLIGIALTATAVGGLEIQVSNTCETPADCRLLWETLEDLDARTPPPDWKLHKRGTPLLGRLLFREDLKEIFARHQTVYARFQLLRAAVAAQHTLATSGNWPRWPSEFAPLLPSGPGNDPFPARTVPYGYGPRGTRDFVLWSTGPDAGSEGGGLQYDPTNGTISRGDIVMELSRDRRYPFPTSGTAVSADEIPARFPHGLPPDVFADTKTRSLSVSTTSPAVVYSFGPDTDEFRIHGSASPDVPEVRYDPTNGTVSDGDLIRVLKQ